MESQEKSAEPSESQQVHSRTPTSLTGPSENPDYSRLVSEEQLSPQEVATLVDEFRDLALTLLKTHSAHELMPPSSKVVVFDIKLTVKHAFDGLIEHDIKCAPVWNAEKGDFVGIVTVTDFIDILTHLYKSRSGEDEFVGVLAGLEDQTLGDWSELGTLRVLSESLYGIDPDQTLYDGVRMLQANHYHLMPVIQRTTENTVLCILNYRKLLRFVTENIYDKHPDILTRLTCKDLGIGTYGEKVIACTGNTRLIDVLDLLEANKVSSCPIVDEQGKYLDCYSKSDIRYLALDGTYDKIHTLTVSEAIGSHHHRDKFPTCQRSTCLDVLFERLLYLRKSTAVILSDDDRVEGTISLAGDLFTFFLSGRRPSGGATAGQSAIARGLREHKLAAARRSQPRAKSVDSVARPARKSA
eukprot:103128_1